MKKLLQSSITKTMNAYLKLDPESKLRLKKLHGKTITIEFLPIHFIFQCSFTENGATIQTDELQNAETTIRGTPLQLLGVAMTRDHRHRFFAEDLVIEGNAEVGQQVIELFDELQIDWEEHLSRVVGDVPAHHVGRLIRGIGEWLRTTEETLSQDINEYVHEETEWFPTREALQDFFSDIDNLRMDVDRAEAKINQLQAHGFQPGSTHHDTQEAKNSEMDDEGSQ